MIEFSRSDNEINDGIVRDFHFPAYIIELLDTAEVGRLHHIVQNGFTGVSYPNLSHSRKAHSIGAARNALKMWRAATETGPLELETTDREAYERTIAAAGILHDIGHSPLSHDLETLIEKFTHKSHEAVAAEMIADGFSLHQFYATIPREIMTKKQAKVLLKVLDKIPRIEDVLSHFNIDREIVAQIVYSDRVRGDKKDAIGSNCFLREIMNGKVIDADKMDYLQRDVQNAGITEVQFDPAGIIDSLGLVRTNGSDHLAISDKGIEMVTQLLTTRAYMYSRAYTHKTTLKTQAMVYEAYKLFLRSLGDDAQKYGSALYLLDDKSFETFMAMHKKADPIATELYMTAKYDRKSKYDIAYRIESKDIPLPLDDIEGHPLVNLYRKLLSIPAEFPEDEIKKGIQESYQKMQKKSIPDHEVIVYFPTPRKMYTKEQMEERFDLHIFQHRDPTIKHHASEILNDPSLFDARLVDCFRAFSRHQTSNYFLVFSPSNQVEEVNAATTDYLKSFSKN